MEHSTKGFLAGATGFGLLLGGTCLALWPDGPEFNDAKLQVAVQQAPWRELSGDATQHTLQARYLVSVALVGDNMVTRCMLVVPDPATEASLADAVALSYEIFDSLGRPVATDNINGATVTLASPDSYHADRRITVGSHGKTDFTVVVTVIVDPAASAHHLAALRTSLAEAQLELHHVRNSADGFP